MRDDLDPFRAFTVDKHLAVPVFQQIVSKLNCIIIAEQLKSGDALPPIRVLAGWLGVNPNTVVRAYAELQAAGVIVKRQGSGCVVASSQADSNSSQLARLNLKAQIEELIANAGAAGVPPYELIEMIRSRAGGSIETSVPKPRLRPKVATTTSEERSNPGASPIWQPDDAFID